MGHQSTIDAGNDVVSFLKAQHQRVKGFFSKVLSAKGEAREDAFFALRRLMAIHVAIRHASPTHHTRARSAAPARLSLSAPRDRPW